MKEKKGFSLIAVIVAMAIVALLAGAIVPMMFNRLDQSRYTLMMEEMQTIYEASMGVPAENYFGFVGDVGRLPATTAELLDSTGQGMGTSWNGPYLSLGGNMRLQDVYGSDYVIETTPIQIRSYGPDTRNGTEDDIIYPSQNALTTFSGDLVARLLINGRLITEPGPGAEAITSTLSYAVNGDPTIYNLDFNTSDDEFITPDPVHQGIHVLTLVAAKETLGGQDPVTTYNEQFIILPGATTRITVSFEDADYWSRVDRDLNDNDLPDRFEDMDGDGIPDEIDDDRDGDGTINGADTDPDNPRIGGVGGDWPGVISVTPNNGDLGVTAYPITIVGLGFEDGATVTFSGTGITVPVVTWVSATRLDIEVNIDASATPEWRDVTILNLNGLSGTEENIFQILAEGEEPAPLISLVDPDEVVQGATGLLISIQGQNFVSGIAASFSNTDIAITLAQYVDDTELRVTIDVDASASTGAGTVRVTNPDLQYNEATFTVNPQPDITSLDPNSVPAGRRNFRIDIIGTDFMHDITVTSSDDAMVSIRSYSWSSSTLISLRVDAGAYAGSTVQIIVTNPDGGTDSETLTIN